MKPMNIVRKNSYAPRRSPGFTVAPYWPVNKEAAHPCLRLIIWDPAEPVVMRPLAIQKDGTWYCYGLDITKNVWELFGPSRYIRTAYDYTPYGGVTEEGDITQPVQWSSDVYDEELALVYYNYRHYNPMDGRWINRDPIAEQGGWNLYAFVGNNPQDKHDDLELESYEEIKVPFKGKEKCCKDILTFENLQKSTRFGLYVKKHIGDIIFWDFWKETPPLTHEDMKSVKKCYELSGRRDIIMTYRVKRKDGWDEGYTKLGENQLLLLGFGNSRMTLNGITNKAPAPFYTSS